MDNTSKICDAADWFDPEIKLIIENELKEPARFHRKQWEFAMIFLTLQKFGLLKNQKVGLSLGGGNERVLYSIANHIKKLFVTDLYEDKTSWDCARTNDPDEFIKASKPFPVDDTKIQALRMDMRNLDFADNTFDFCYSSCAIEHIGDKSDFLQHFNEVNRVLKAGGIYVLTTELQFGDKTIPDENNFIFNKDYISDLIANSDLDFVSDVKVELTENTINYPYPSNIKNLVFSGNDNLSQKIIEQFPHLILLRGNIPFTSVLLILRKGESKRKSNSINFLNYNNTKKFLLQGVENYRSLIQVNKISIFPFSFLPDSVSKYFIDHSDYFSKSLNESNDSSTVFHSDYFWFGSDKREIRIKLKVESYNPDEKNELQIRIHSYSIYDSGNQHCIYKKNITVNQNMIIDELIEFYPMEKANYSFLCKLISGNVACSLITIESFKKNGTDKTKISSMELEGVTGL